MWHLGLADVKECMFSLCLKRSGHDLRWTLYFYVQNCLLVYSEWFTEIWSLKSSWKQNTEERSHCYGNKAQVLYFFTNNVKYRNYNSFNKITCGKQDELLQYVNK